MENTTPELREKIVMKLLENQKYIYNPPFEIILSAAVICNYVQNGKLPIKSAKENDLMLEEIIFDIAKKIYEERNNSVSPTNNSTQPNKSFIQKILGIFRF